LTFELFVGILYAKTLFQRQFKGLLQNAETGSGYEESNDRLGACNTCKLHGETAALTEFAVQSDFEIYLE